MKKAASQGSSGFMIIRSWERGGPSKSLTKALLMAVTAPLFGMMSYLLTERAKALGIIGPGEELALGMSEVVIHRNTITGLKVEVNYNWGEVGSAPFAVINLLGGGFVLHQAAASGKSVLEDARPDVGRGLTEALSHLIREVINQPCFDFREPMERLLRRWH